MALWEPWGAQGSFFDDFWSISEVWEVHLGVPAKALPPHVTTYLIGNAWSLSCGEDLVHLSGSSPTCHHILDRKRFRIVPRLFFEPFHVLDLYILVVSIWRFLLVAQFVVSFKTLI